MYKKLICLVSLVLYLLAGTSPMHAMSESRLERELAAMASTYEAEKVKEEANRLCANNDHDSCLKIFRRALAIAAMQNKTELVRFFLEKGVDANAVSLDDSVPFATPLYYALRNTKNTEMIQLLIAHGATVPSTDSKGRTPFYFALTRNHEPEVVSWILEKMPEACKQTYKGESPLHTAIGHNNDLSVIKELLKYLDINIRDNRNRTPLHCAIYYEALEIASLLLTYSPDVNAQDAEGLTPLHHICRLNSYDTENAKILDNLLQYNPLINVQDQKGRTPLHYAVYLSPDWLMKIILKYNEYINIKDKKGKTVLHEAVNIARKSRFYHVINLKTSLLLLLGAQQCPDNQGKTPLDRAKKIDRVTRRRNIKVVLKGEKPDILKEARMMLIKERIGGQNIVQALNNARFGIKQRGARQPISEANNV